MFGANTNGVFGAQAAKPSTTGFSFGGTSGVQQSGNTAFNFGAKPTANAGTTFSLGSQQPPTSAPTGGIFGTSQPTTSTSIAGGMFGAQPTTTASVAMFGAKPATAPGAFNFGAQPIASAAPAGGILGNPAVSSAGFAFSAPSGVATAPVATSNLFSTMPPATTAGASLGMAPVAAATAQPASTGAGAISPELQRELERIYAAWDLTSPDCQLQHYLYNYAHPSDAPLYQRSAAHNETAWRQAQQDNPDPYCMVPVLTVGFDDLEKRIRWQQRQSYAHEVALKDINDRLDKLRQSHDLQTSSKLAEYRRAQLALTHRVLDLMRKIHLLRMHGRVLRPDEEALRERIDRLQLRLQRPGQYRSRLQELSTLLARIADSRRLEGGTAWNLADGTQLSRIQKTLEEQQRGISHLVETLHSDTRDVEIMEHGHQTHRGY